VDVKESATVRAPVDVVFDTAADPKKQLEWDPKTLRSVEQVSSGPLAQGARFRGSFKGFGNVEYEFVEFDRPRRFAHRARIPAGRMTHRFTFEPVGDATRLTQEGSLEANLLGRLMGPFIRRSLAKRFRTIAAELDAFVTGSNANVAG
jgi:hypothetical protein